LLGISKEWKHARSIDWHTHNPIAVVWLAVSPRDEIFIYDEWGPSPEKFTIWDIAKFIAVRSQDYRFTIDLIDPLANEKQVNTGRSPCEDLNLHAHTFKAEGLGTGAYWQAADTKNERGMDEFRRRLANSLKVGVPFNNLNTNKTPGESRYLSTIWVLDRCPQVIESLKNWRREEWADRNSKLTKDEKDKPQQKYSHFSHAIEYLLKRDEVSKAIWREFTGHPLRPKHYLGRTY
jgi:hypothetical protein